MNASLRKDKFSSIKGLSPDWLNQVISDETEVIIFEFEFGCKITSINNGKKKVHAALEAYRDFTGIILSGEAELYTFSVYEDRTEHKNTYAYRPIRLLTAKEVFGEFSILDKLLLPGKVSRPGENWELVAGRKCYLLTHGLHGQYTKHRSEFGSPTPELFNLVLH